MMRAVEAHLCPASCHPRRHPPFETARLPNPDPPHKLATDPSVRHDHGSQYMSAAFQQELAFLGIESSPAFVRAPEGNGCAERFIRTLKENLLWLRTFDTVEE